MAETQESEARLRARLAEIQRLARVGSWEWTSATGEVRWTDELWALLGREAGSDPACLQTFLACLVPEDRYLHPGHTWVRLLPGGEVEVGVDDFGGRVAGTVSRGACAQGECHDRGRTPQPAMPSGR